MVWLNLEILAGYFQHPQRWRAVLCPRVKNWKVEDGWMDGWMDGLGGCQSKVTKFSIVWWRWRLKDWLYAVRRRFSSASYPTDHMSNVNKFRYIKINKIYDQSIVLPIVIQQLKTCSTVSHIIVAVVWILCGCCSPFFTIALYMQIIRHAW